MTIQITNREKRYIDSKLRLALTTFRMYGEIRQGVIEDPFGYTVATLKNKDERRYHFIHRMYIEYWTWTSASASPGYEFKMAYLHDIGYPLEHLWQYVQSRKRTHLHIQQTVKAVSRITHQAAQKAFPQT